MRGRKLLGAVTSVGVAAGLMSMGVTSAAATVTPPTANPKIEGCGIPITLVMDASGSIDGDEPAKMRAASTAFLNGLNDTNSSARIVEFATTSKELISRKNIQGQGLTDLIAAVNSYKSGGLGNTTNWESPLWRTLGEPIPGKGLVVFMTDGDPNTTGDINGSGTTYPVNAGTAASAAEVYANQLKTAGNRMLAVGIGTSNDGQKDRLKQISGPNLVTSIGATDTINDFDAVVTDSFDDLTAAMKRVAASLCGGSITVRKFADPDTPGEYAPAGGWKFDATVTPGTVPDDFVWVQPAGETSNTASLTTQSTPGVPATDGVAQFQYAPKNTTTRTVRISETVKAGYLPNWYECTFKGLDPPNDVQGGLTIDGDKAYFEVTLKADESVSCDVYNMRGLAELKLVKQVEGADPDSWTLTAKADEPNDSRNVSTLGGSGQFETVYSGIAYTLGESGPAGYSGSEWSCVSEPREVDVEPAQVQEEVDLKGNTLILTPWQRVTCTIVNTRDLGSLTITKEFNPQTSGFTGTFDITYACVDGATPVKNGTVSLAAGQSETISGLPTGTTCTVDEPALPAAPTGWTFNQPTYSPSKSATVTTKDQTANVTVVNSISQVSPVVVKKVCPIDVTLVKPKPKKIGNRVLVKKIKTKKSSCVLLKPVVLCRPIASSAAGETAFCDTKVTKKGRITVKTKGYDGVRVSVVVRSKPKPGFEDRWKPDTWRKSWRLT